MQSEIGTESHESEHVTHSQSSDTESYKTERLSGAAQRSEEQANQSHIESKSEQTATQTQHAEEEEGNEENSRVNAYHAMEEHGCFTDVRCGGPEQLTKDEYKDWTLFLCWYGTCFFMLHARGCGTGMAHVFFPLDGASSSPLVLASPPPSPIFLLYFG
jgi:hypothetical protein